MTQKRKVLVVGGGFGGVKAALDLAACGDCEVTLLSDHSHFRYYPTLYLAATGGKRAGARIRLSDIFEGLPITFVRATATKLNRDNKTIETSDGKSFGFDTLILALGNVTNYFGIAGLEQYSYSIKSSEEVERFKLHIHQQFIEHGCPDLNYVIVGGGPTGIELAGALPGYLQEVMRRHNVNECKLNIMLVEAAPKLLPRAPEAVSNAIYKRLQSLGVTIMTNTAVKGQTADTLMVDDKPLKSHTVVWTAGVTNNPFFKANNFVLNDRGKVAVDQYLQAEPGIFVLGDNADTPFSGYAQTALHDGTFVAANILRQCQNQPLTSYVPKKPISVIPVGSYWASVEWGTWRSAGFIGWLLRIAADFIGFHDLQSWPKAGKQWLMAMGEEDLDCPNCTKTATPTS